MIDINLIPVDKGRRRKKGGFLHAGFMLPREVIVGLIGGFLVLLALGHILLQVAVMIQYVELKQQKEQWKKILPAKKEVDKIMKDLQTRQLRYKAIMDIRGSSDISWAGKLNALSLELPRGVWLRGVLFEEGSLLIRGSSFSKQEMEKINIYSYVKRLKENKTLMDGVISIEVELIESRQIAGTPISDFVIRMIFERDAVDEEGSQQNAPGTNK